MRTEAEVRRMAERLEDESRRAFTSHGQIGGESEKEWRIARKRAERKAQALRWVLEDEIEP